MEIEGRIDAEKWVKEVFGANYQADEYELSQPIGHKVFEDLTGEPDE